MEKMALKENLQNSDMEEFFNRFIKLPCYHAHYVEKYYDHCLERIGLEMDGTDMKNKCQLLWDGFNCIIKSVERDLGSRCRKEDTVTVIRQQSSDIWSSFRINATNCLQSVLTKQGAPDVSPSSSVLPLLIGCTAGGLVAVLMILAIILIYRRWNKNNGEEHSNSRSPYRNTLERRQYTSNTLYNTYQATPVYYTNDIQVNHLGGYEIPAATSDSEDEIYEEIKSVHEYENNKYESPCQSGSNHNYDQLLGKTEKPKESTCQETAYVECSISINMEDNGQYMDMSSRNIYVNSP